MLLEAYQLLANRIGQGHTGNQSHEHFSTNISKGYDTWRLILNLDGSIYGIEPMGDKEKPGFWSLVEGTSAKAKRFPALRPTSPLLLLGVNADEWEKLRRLSDKNMAESKNLLLGLADALPQNPQDFLDAWTFKAAPVLKWQTEVNSDPLLYLQQCVKAFGRFCGLSEDEDTDWKLPKKDERTLLGKEAAKKLTFAFVTLLKRSTEVNQVKAIAAFMLGKRKGEANPKIEVATQLCIDLHLPDALESTVYTPRMAKMALGCLGAGSDDGPQGICAISGRLGPLLKTKFPEWDSGLFKISPYSKFKDAPCNQRYQRFGLDALDVSSNLARSLVGALNGMVDPSLEWKTWVKLHNGKFRKESGKKPIPLKDLMLAYPSFDIEDLVTVDVFTQRRAEDVDEETERAMQFVDCAEHLCRALQGKSGIASDDAEYMRVMLVRSVSKGQVQLSYAAVPTVKEFVSALEAWTRSGNNLPPRLQVPLPYKRSITDCQWRLPRLLFPEQITRLLTQQWTRDGSESTYIQGPPVGMVLDLFLRKPGVWEETAMRLLEMTLDRGEALLVGAGHVLHREDHGASEPWRLWKSFIEKAQSAKDKRYPHYALAQTISLIGSLLYAMNSNAQDYMKESSYLVGKLLAMMDELHKCYCVVVRDGDIPNALIGNGLLGRAAESPVLALEELSDRSRIYIGWAKTAAVIGGATEKQKIAVNSARKVLRLAQPLVERLHTDSMLEKELPPIGKAHLFLGYLSPVLGKDDGDGLGKGGDPVETDAADKN